MSEQGEFYAESDPGFDGLRWKVIHRDAGCGWCGYFQGPHAEADAREHATKCNTRAKAERRAEYVVVLSPTGDYEVIKRVTGVGWRIAAFYGDRAKAEAEAYAGSLIGRDAAAEPTPPKGPRYVAVEHAIGAWTVISSSREIACFPGPDAKQRACDYAAWLNGEIWQCPT